MALATRIHNPGLAAVLSAIVPGLGQIYNGDFLRGLFWLIITPGLWIGSGGLLGWICHVVSAYTAHSRARRKNASPMEATCGDPSYGRVTVSVAR